MKSDRIKLIDAVVIFVAAAVIIAYNMGVFGGSSAPVVQTPTAGQQPKGGPRAVTPGQ